MPRSTVRFALLTLLILGSASRQPGVNAQITPSCPCTIWASILPSAAFDARGAGRGQEDSGDATPVEVGVKFRSSVNGYITGLRFYKSTLNTGPHVANLWTTTGVLLATATYANETPSGWQDVTLPTPVAVAANTMYVASYYAPRGHYAFNAGFFATSGTTNGPLTAPAFDGGGGNAYKYAAASTFPDQGVPANYWIDVVFNTTVANDTTPPTIVSVAPAPNVSGFSTATKVTATFSEAIAQNTLTATTFTLRDGAASTVAGTLSFNPLLKQAVLDPTAGLAPLTTYTATVSGGAAGVKDLAGNPLSADYVWSFTTASPPPAPPDQGPGGPILVITNASLPFGRYYAEILRAEGLNAFNVTDLSLVSASTLSGYDVVILAETLVTDAQAAMFDTWVNGGGKLIAMRPDKKLAGLLGLTDNVSTLADSYLLFNTVSGPGGGLVNQTIQFHGVADRYTLNGASSLATLYSNASTPTASPAASLRSVGANGGQAAAFAFDVARSVVYTRQGNPAWAGQERDGIPPIRPDDQFFGNAAADPKPNYVDFTRITIPQADELQRLLANLVIQMNLSKKPLPRFWYLPRGLKAAVVMTGDDQSSGLAAGRFDHYVALSPLGCSVANWECVRSTANVFIPDLLSEAQAGDYVARGFELGLQIRTNCADYTPASMESFIATQLANFAAAHPTLPQPTTNRTQCVVWSDWASQAKVEKNHGIRFDTNYYYWPGSWLGTNWAGLFTGSGMPQRFADADGTLIDVYQAATQLNDETGQGQPTTINTLLDNALGPLGYYGVFTANMHHDQVVSPAGDIIVASAQARGVPVVSAKQMLDWLDGRNGSSFGNFLWSGNVLSFTVSTAPGSNGIQAMVPSNTPVGGLNAITWNGATVPYTLQTIKGIQYAVFQAASGSYQASYLVPGISISNVSLPEGNSGTAAFTFAVNLSSLSASTVTVDYATTNGTATAGSDYVAQSGTLTFLPGQTSKSIVVTVNGDALNEADETFFVNLSNQTNALIANSPAVGTILNDDPMPSVSIGNVTANEGSAGNTNFVFNVTLSAASGQTVTANYATANITATAPSDYTASAGVVTFAPGSTLQTITIIVIGDLLAEPDETFAVNLTAPTNATLATAQGIGTILNDDLISSMMTGNLPAANATNVAIASPVDVWFSVPMNESTFTASTFRLRAAGAVSDIASSIVLISDAWKLGYAGTTARLVPNALLTPNTLYTATLAGTVRDTAANLLGADVVWSFTTGSAPPPCPCRLWDSLTPGQLYDIRGPGRGQVDGQDGNSVEVGVKFRSAVNGFITGLRFYKGPLNVGPHVANLWTSAGVLLATATYANETASGWQEVALPTPVAIAANTTYLASYFAPQGHYSYNRDFLLPSSYSNGPLSAQRGDDVGVGGNNVYKYSATSTLPTTGVNANYWIDVVFNSTAAPVPSISINNVTAQEGNVGSTNFTFTATLSAPSDATVTVAYATADGTATAGSDYVAQSGTLTFLPGETSKPVTVVVNGDTLNEANETFFVNLSGPTNASIGTASGTGTIGNDDPAPSFSINDVSVAEGNAGVTNMVFTVTLSAASGQTLTVNFATADGTAIAPTDYTATSGTVTFAAGITARPVTVAVNGDLLVEPNETILVNLSAPSAGTLAKSQGIGTIVNDDLPPSITNRTPAPNATNVPVSAKVDVVFSQPMNPATIVAATFRMRAAGASSDLPGLITYAGTTATFTPNGLLTPGTVYTVTVAGTVADMAGDAMGADVSWSFTTSTAPPQRFTDTTVFDFSAGTFTNTAASTRADGEVSLSPAVGNNFDVDGLPPGWTLTTWSPSGGGVVQGGVISVNGSRIYTAATFGPGRTLEFLGLFSATGALQHIGLGTDFNSAPWTIFSTAGGGALYARTFNGTSSTDTPIPGNFFGAWHLFRIDWNPASVVYFIDGVQVASHPIVISASMRPMVSDYTPDTQPLMVDWLALSPYAASGTFLSRVIDAGSLAGWGNVGWDASLPAGTTLQISVRQGNTLTPDGTWTAFAPIPASNSQVGGQSRYLQYQAAMTSTSANVTPLLQAIRFDLVSSSGVSINDVSVIEGNTATVDTVFTVTVTNATGPVSVDYATSDGTATTAGGDYIGKTGTLNFPFGTTTQTVIVQVNGDTLNEANETFSVNLSNAVGATISKSQGIGTITNDDPLPAISINDVSLNEGNIGTTSFIFNVTLSAPSGQSVTVAYATANGTATSGSDYTAGTGTLTFPPGTTLQPVTVSVIGDTVGEPNETFFVNLSAPTNATIAKTQGIGTIINDDADTIPPTITARAPAPSAVDAPLDGVVTVTFSEFMTAATFSPTTFRLRANGAATDVPATVAYNGFIATLTSTSPLTTATAYTATVAGTVTDLANNPLGADVSWTFTTASATPTFTDTTVANFTGGTPDAGTAITQVTDGEVTLAPSVNAEFGGTALAADWSSATWASGGTTTVAGGLLSVNGARARVTAVSAPGRSLEFVATFSTTATFQHVAFAATTDMANPPWIAFSTFSGGALYARTSNGTTSTNTSLGSSWLGAPHRFRIDWTSTGEVFWIDGAQVASHAIAVTASMRPLVSDYTVGGPALTVDWLRMTPYAAAGTFTSRVFDAGAVTTWGTATWAATQPAGTSLVVSVRRGNTATPDATWTAFSALAVSGAAVGGNSRYVQYKIDLATTAPGQSASLNNITIAGTIP